ncbi:MAG: hypothetical protein ACTSRZ_14800 [Promethearchaeota archaeon]
MSATHVHFLINLVIWYVFLFLVFLVSKIFNLELDSLITRLYNVFGLEYGFYFVIGGIFFDLDHFIYYFLTTKPLNINNIRARMSKDFKEENPHPYIFHSIEFLFIWAISIILLNSSQEGDVACKLINISLFFGWILHIFIDIKDYLKKYRSLKPWLKYFSLFYLVLKYRIKYEYRKNRK